MAEPLRCFAQVLGVLPKLGVLPSTIASSSSLSSSALASYEES